MEIATVLLGLVLAATAVAGRLCVEQKRADLEGDTLYYVAWGEQAHELGVLKLYGVSHELSLRRWGRHAMNYGPAYAYYVWAQNALRRTLVGEAKYYHPGILLPLMVPVAACYVVVGVALIAALRGRLGVRKAALAACLYYLSPGMLAVSPWKGQTDAFVVLVMLLSLSAALDRRWALMGAVWMFGMMVKPQPILLAPVLAFLLFRTGHRRDWLKAVLAASAVLIVAAGPFLIGNSTWETRLACLRRPFIESFGLWNTTTNKAYNLWWIDRAITGATDPASPILGVARGTWGTILVAGAVVAALLAMWRRRGADIVTSSAAAAVIGSAAFLLATRAWDRYLCYGLAMAIPLALVDRCTLATYAVMSLAWLANLLTSIQLRLESAGRAVPSVESTGVVCAAVLLAAFAVLAWRVVRLARPQGGLLPSPGP